MSPTPPTPPTPPTREVTRLLNELEAERPEVAERLMALIYDELHRLAERCMYGERRDHTLQPTALVHEAYLRLVDQDAAGWKNRAQFFKMAATMMRRILVDHARKHRALKRGGEARKVRFTGKLEPGREEDIDLVLLNDALERLAAQDPTKGEIVELRFFAGLSAEETARVIDTSLRTVERHWALARAWLYRELQAG